MTVSASEIRGVVLAAASEVAGQSVTPDDALVWAVQVGSINTRVESAYGCIA